MHCPQDVKAALVVAHPSHELRVHGWVQLTSPTVFVLTDGSGRSNCPRLSATSKALSQVGATPGCIYGRLTDLGLYAAILDQDLTLFLQLANELAKAFVVEEIKYVVGDAAEGYSSAHDICRFLVNAAVEIANRTYGWQVGNFDFLVIDPPDRYSKEEDERAIWIHLDEVMFARKISAAKGYDPALSADVDAAIGGQLFQGIKRFSEPKIAEEVDVKASNMILAALKSRPELNLKVRQVLRGVELNEFQIECLRPVSMSTSWYAPNSKPLFYEIYGEKLVAAGRYKHVIRYREHVLPIIEALWEHIDRMN